MSKTYVIPVSFTFNGKFVIKAESREAAENAVEQSCGLRLGEVHSSLPDDQVDWRFPVHPEKTIIKNSKKKGA